MSDRPLHSEVDTEEKVPMPVRVGTSWTVTKEQLEAAERTRNYHLRRLQNMLQRSQHAGQAAPRGEF